MSHRMGTRACRDPELHVSRNMNEAVPRSHLKDYEDTKVAKLSPLRQYLRGLDSQPFLSAARVKNQQVNSSMRAPLVSTTRFCHFRAH